MLSEIPNIHEMTHVVCAVGSAGTIAGLLLGRALFDLKLDVWGVIVCDSILYLQQKIQSIIQEFNTKFHTNYTTDKSTPGDYLGPYTLYDHYIGEGYGIPFPNEIKLIKDVSRAEGIILDPSYSGKAFYGLIDLLHKNKLEKDSFYLKKHSMPKIVFLDSGGLFGLLAQSEKFC